MVPFGGFLAPFEVLRGSRGPTARNRNLVSFGVMTATKPSRRNCQNRPFACRFRRPVTRVSAFSLKCLGRAPRPRFPFCGRSPFASAALKNRLASSSLETLAVSPSAAFIRSSAVPSSGNSPSPRFGARRRVLRPRAKERSGTRKYIQGRAKQRRGRPVVIAGESGADCLEIGAELERD